jgi:uncharacterized phage protein (TIGR01671 family)
MREIKFRAWDIKKEKMHYNIQQLDFRNLEVHYTDRYQVGEKGKDWNNTLEVEIMQYTGLKGKNGKDIYEGDCFSINRKDTGTRIGVAWVEWDNFYSRYALKDTRGEGEYNLHYFIENQEVIGNIYEHPELIN